MIEDRQLAGLLESWFAEGPTEMPDRVIDRVVDRIALQPQRRVLGLLGRPTRWTYLKVAAAVAAILLAGSVGLLLSGRPPAVVPPPVQPSAVPTSRSSPTASRQRTPSPSPAIGPGLIVFEHFTPGLLTRLEYLAPDRRGMELLPAVPGNQHLAAWSPDGQRLAYSGFDPDIDGSREAIFETDASGATPRSITAGCTPPACLEETSPSYSTDGRQLVFIRTAGAPGGPPTSTVVAIRDLDTHKVSVLEPTRTAYPGAVLEHPSLSPDGRSIVYTKLLLDPDDQATDSLVFVVARDGGRPLALTAAGFKAGDPTWSPDGSRILFGSEVIHHWFGGGKGASYNTFVYTMAADGSDQAQLTTVTSGSPSWTGHGTQVLYIVVPLATIGTPDFFVMATDGSQQRPVATYGDCCRWYPVQQPTP